MRATALVCFICCFVWSPAKAFLTDPVIIQKNQKELMVAPQNLEVLEDISNQLTIQDIVAGKYTQKFQGGFKDHPGVRKINTAYWIRFRVKFGKETETRWLMEVLDAHISHIKAYIQFEDKLTPFDQAGYREIFTRRKYRHKNFLYELPYSSDKPLTIYFYVKSDSFNPFFIKLHANNNFIYYALNEYHLLGIYYGILVIMAMYNLMLFLYVRERMYLYYVLYVVSCILVSYAEDGLGFQYIWFNVPIMNILVDKSAHMVFLVFFTIYARTFLELKKNAPGVNKVLNLILLLFAGYFLLTAFFPIYSHAYTFALLIPFLLIYAAAARMYFKGNKAMTQFFLLGYSFTIIGLISLALRKNGVAFFNIFYIYSLNIGLLVEVVFFSLALAYRLRLIKKEKELAQQRMIEHLQENEKIITQKVIERTEEIARQNTIIEEKNKELEQQAEEIKQMNELLNKENQELQSNVKELTKARVLLRDVDFTEFSKIFPDEESCYKYLAELKWSDKFQCIRCEGEKYTKGQGHFARRCSKCGYNESATVNTIFHHSHIPIQKSFYMLFLVYANKGDITSTELSQILSMRQPTCWKFRKKVLEKMKADKNTDKHDHLDGWGRLILD